jgi:S-layer family protein
MKKLLSLVLVLALVLSSFSFAFAFEDTADLDCEEAVDTLVALGVINGFSDDTFRPENTVTRAQIAKMLVVALGYEDLISGTSSSFTDCAGHWADSYIAFAAGQGIVNGYPDGTFKPDATVSYDEAITMIVRALGYTDDCLAGTWPTNYKIKALDLGITDDVKLTTGGADRGGVAMLIYNAIEAEIVTVNADDEIVYAEDNKVTMLDRLGDKLDGDDAIKVTPDVLDEDADEYVESNIDLEPYMFETLEVYTIDDVVVYISDTVTDTLEGDATYDTKMVVEDADEDETDIIAVATDKIYFNGALADTTHFNELDGAVVKVVFEADEDGDAKTGTTPVGIVATLDTDCVQIEDEYEDGDLNIDDIDLPVTTDDDDDEIVNLDALTIEGDATSLEDIKEDDVVTVYAADDDSDSNPQAVKLVVTRSTVEGKVTKVKSNGDVVIDGTTYDTSAYDYTDRDAVVLGDEGTFYLDNAGEIFAWTGESTELTNYAVVVGTDSGTTTAAFGTEAVDTYAQIKLAKADGETVVYDLYSDIDDNVFEGFVMTLADGSTDQAVTAAGGDITPYTFADGALVLYDLNSDDQVDELEIVSTEDVNGKDLTGSNLDDKYRITSDTVIFDASDDYAVVDLDDLDDTITGSAVVESDSSWGNLEVLIVSTGVISSEAGNYAVLLDADDTLDSDDDPIQELSVLIDGVEATYLTDDNFVTTTKVANFYFNIENLDIDTDGVVTSMDTVDDTDTDKDVLGDAPDGANAVTVAAIDSDLIRLSNNVNYEINEDVVVYVSSYDADEEEWTVETGDLKDIDEEDYVKVYDVDVAEDDGYEIIIVFTGDIDEL